MGTIPASRRARKYPKLRQPRMTRRTAESPTEAVVGGLLLMALLVVLCLSAMVAQSSAIGYLH